MRFRNGLISVAFAAAIALLPSSGAANPISFSIVDTVDPTFMFGVFTVDDADPNFGITFQPILDWNFFVKAGPATLTPDDDPTFPPLAFIDPSDVSLSLLHFHSSDTSRNSGAILVLEDRFWATEGPDGQFIVRPSAVPAPAILNLMGVGLSVLVLKRIVWRAGRAGSGPLTAA